MLKNGRESAAVVNNYKTKCFGSQLKMIITVDNSNNFITVDTITKSEHLDTYF